MLKLVEEDLETPSLLSSLPQITLKVGEISLVQTDEKQCHSISSFLWVFTQHGLNNARTNAWSRRPQKHPKPPSAAAQSSGGATKRGQDTLGQLPTAWAPAQCWQLRQSSPCFATLMELCSYSNKNPLL